MKIMPAATGTEKYKERPSKREVEKERKKKKEEKKRCM